MRVPGGVDVCGVHLRAGLGVHKPEAQPQQADHSRGSHTAARVHRCQLHRGEDRQEGEFRVIYYTLLWYIIDSRLAQWLLASV